MMRFWVLSNRNVTLTLTQNQVDRNLQPVSEAQSEKLVLRFHHPSNPMYRMRCVVSPLF